LVSPTRIYGSQSGTWAGTSVTISVFPCQSSFHLCSFILTYHQELVQQAPWVIVTRQGAGTTGSMGHSKKGHCTYVHPSCSSSPSCHKEHNPTQIPLQKRLVEFVMKLKNTCVYSKPFTYQSTASTKKTPA
jgi:hypothetical protein